ncbi:MAG TPA: hypothetical protein EYQ00_05810 [Dehalococcoidia bacterium]|nr:hypothetical protein [Dehalococcoidia bacterium]
MTPSNSLPKILPTLVRLTGHIDLSSASMNETALKLLTATYGPSCGTDGGWPKLTIGRSN